MIIPDTNKMIIDLKMVINKTIVADKAKGNHRLDDLKVQDKVDLISEAYKRRGGLGTNEYRYIKDLWSEYFFTEN